MNSENTDDLIRTGWEKRFVIDRSRVDEYARLYGEAGFDVKILSREPGGAPQCSTCTEPLADSLMVIYTRKSRKAGGHASEGEV